MLLRPAGRVYFAGDHVSYLSGWMAGALESGQRVAEAIHSRSSRERTVAAEPSGDTNGMRTDRNPRGE